MTAFVRRVTDIFWGVFQTVVPSKEFLNIRLALKNSAWLFTAEGAGTLLKLLLLFVIARLLGPAAYGQFSFALAFVSLGVVFADFGLTSITTREIVYSEDNERKYGAILSLKAVLSVATLLGIITVGWFISSDPIIRVAIMILAPYIVLLNFTDIFYAFFRAKQKMQYEAWNKILQALLVTTIGIAFVVSNPTVFSASISYLIGVGISFVTLIFLFAFKYRLPGLIIDTIFWRKMLKLSWPLGLVAVFSVIYAQIDSVMMGIWGYVTEVGWYSAAYRIIAIVSLPAGLMARAFFPLFSTQYKTGVEQIQNAWNSCASIVVFITLPLVVGGTVVASNMVVFLYGQEFLPSVLALQILLFAALLNSLLIIFYFFLTAVEKQQKVFWITFGGAVINILLNFILIPVFTLYGAAVATLATMLIMAGFSLYHVHMTKIIHLWTSRIKRSILLSVISAGIMIGALHVISEFNLHILISILLGGIVYGAAALVGTALFFKNQTR